MATGNDADVVIVGAGIFGLSCAWSCLRSGLRVIVVDLAAPGSGASGGVVGAMSPHVPERWDPLKQFQFEALVAAGPHWAEVERISGRKTGFGRVGRLIPIIDEAALGRAHERAEVAAHRWADAARWQVCKADAFANWLDPQIAPSGLIHETLSARIRPRDAVAALAVAVERLGGDIRPGWAARGFLPGVVEGTRESLRAEKTIVAAGLEAFGLLAPFLGPDAGSGVKGQALLLRATAPGRPPIIFADGTYVIAHDNGTIAVGSTSENQWSDPVSTDAQLDVVRARAERICPALRGAPTIQRWAGVRPKARRRDPMLGPVPGCDGLFAATGGFKIGFGVAHSIGDVLAQMVQGKDAALPETFTLDFHLR